MWIRPSDLDVVSRCGRFLLSSPLPAARPSPPSLSLSLQGGEDLGEMAVATEAPVVHGLRDFGDPSPHRSLPPTKSDVSDFDLF